MPSNAALACLQAMYLGMEAEPQQPSRKARPTCTRRSESLNGKGCSSTPFNTEKMAVFAPIPSASAETATAVNPGFLRRTRRVYCRSCVKADIAHIRQKVRVQGAGCSRD